MALVKEASTGIVDQRPAGWKNTDPKELIFPKIRDWASVLDVGCSVGTFGGMLRRMKRCRVVGIDVSEPAVSAAKSQLDEAVVLDLDDHHALAAFLAGRSFDIVTCVDVLEHCRFPERVLSQLRPATRDDGALFVSLPNVANYRVRIQLLRGHFHYTDHGLLDRTHLRFFTLTSALGLVSSAGYEIRGVEVTCSHPSMRWLATWRKNLIAQQFVISAIPATPPGTPRRAGA
jgi:2-polyprenyl-3-methyl-5-hydroxy-6-metoxy-1,4-benzoquinol methylase